jgi:hypothetical protein
VGLSIAGKHWCLIGGVGFLLLGIIFGLIIRPKKETAPQPQQAPVSAPSNI